MPVVSGTYSSWTQMKIVDKSIPYKSKIVYTDLNCIYALIKVK